MNEIQIFNSPEFGEVRTVLIDGEPWFMGKDVAGVLGYSNEKNAIKRHCDEGEVLKQTLGVQTGMRKDGTPAFMDVEAFFINESGLYSLIFGSKLDSAKKFKKWVTSEVLPQLRKTGSYGNQQLPAMTTQEQIKLLAQGTTELNQRVDTLQERMDRFEMDLPILPVEAERITTAVQKRGVAVLGGKHSPAYHNRATRQRVYNNLYSNLKYNFDVRTFKALKRCQCDKAVEIVKRYEPPFFLAEEIRLENEQDGAEPVMG